jgi:hypothetical protein
MNEVVKEFGMSGNVSRDYSHPQADAILAESQNVLAEIPEGQRLLSLAKEKSYIFKVMVGKQADWHVMPPSTLTLICPANTKAVNLEEMALSLGLGLRELEQPSVGIARPTMDALGQLPDLTFKYSLDISMEMYKIVTEFDGRDKYPKFLDLLKRLGHSDIYKGYRAGKSQQEIAVLLDKAIKS